MNVLVMSLDGDEVGSVSLPESIFGLEPRKDILHRLVRWQRAKAMQGTHKAKTRSETSYSSAKIVRQKGTGGARHGDRNAPIFRKGGAYKGPTPRSHAHKLNKKFRTLGLKHALSAKAKSGELIILNEATSESKKTSELAKRLNKLDWGRTLIIDGKVPLNENFKKAASNIQEIDILPSLGANAYDILRHETLAITVAGLAELEERLK